MIIECELLNQPKTYFLDSIWTHNFSDPLAVVVEFGDDGPVWTLSLDLLMEAFTDPCEGLHGYGDLLVEVEKDFTLLHLSNGTGSASLRFSTADIQSFLDEVETPGSDEVIARELDSFLETL